MKKRIDKEVRCINNRFALQLVEGVIYFAEYEDSDFYHLKNFPNYIFQKCIFEDVKPTTITDLIKTKLHKEVRCINDVGIDHLLNGHRYFVEYENNNYYYLRGFPSNQGGFYKDRFEDVASIIVDESIKSKLAKKQSQERAEEKMEKEFSSQEVSDVLNMFMDHFANRLDMLGDEEDVSVKDCKNSLVMAYKDIRQNLSPRMQLILAHALLDHNF